MLSLQHGRTLAVQQDGSDELVEVRSASGMVELRVKLTDDGVVLQLDGVRISLKAAESIDVECNSFNLNAQSELRMESGGDLRVKGEMVYIN